MNASEPMSADLPESGGSEAENEHEQTKWLKELLVAVEAYLSHPTIRYANQAARAAGYWALYDRLLSVWDRRPDR